MEDKIPLARQILCSLRYFYDRDRYLNRPHPSIIFLGHDALDALAEYFLSFASQTSERPLTLGRDASEHALFWRGIPIAFGPGLAPTHIAWGHPSDNNRIPLALRDDFTPNQKWRFSKLHEGVDPYFQYLGQYLPQPEPPSLAVARQQARMAGVVTLLDQFEDQWSQAIDLQKYAKLKEASGYCCHCGRPAGLQVCGGCGQSVCGQHCYERHECPNRRHRHLSTLDRLGLKITTAGGNAVDLSKTQIQTELWID